MRRLSPFLLVLALVAVHGCSDPPTAPDGSAVLKKAFVGHESGRLVASGQLREGEWKISFGGHADRGSDGSFRGSWQAHLHSVSVEELEGRKFAATEILGLSFVESDNPAECIARANLYMAGTLDGVPGFYARVLAADAGKIGGDAFDSFRLVIYDSDSAPLYDASSTDPARPGGDFPAVSNCRGGSRAALAHGNVKIWFNE